MFETSACEAGAEGVRCFGVFFADGAEQRGREVAEGVVR